MRVDVYAVEKIARFFLREFDSTVSKGGKWLNEMDRETQKKERKARCVVVTPTQSSVGVA